MILILLILVVLSACSRVEEADEERVQVEEKIEKIEFGKKTSELGLSRYDKYTVTTDKLTYVVVNYSNDKFIKSTESKLVYDLDEDGEKHDFKIYLNEKSLKEYSETYAGYYNKTLPLLVEKPIVIEKENE